MRFKLIWSLFTFLISMSFLFSCSSSPRFEISKSRFIASQTGKFVTSHKSSGSIIVCRTSDKGWACPTHHHRK